MTLGRLFSPLRIPFLALAVASCTNASPDRPPAAATDSSASVAPLPEAAPYVQTPATRGALALRCGLKGSNALGETGIGDLQVGRTISAVKQSCYVSRDAVGPWIEGSTQRILTVHIGSETLRASVDGGIIGSIVVRTPRFVTADGLRVGTPLSRFVGEKRVRMTEGEQGLYLHLASHCGLAFHFSIQSRARPGMAWPPPKLAEQHGTATVDQIVITRCRAVT